MRWLQRPPALQCRHVSAAAAPPEGSGRAEAEQAEELCWAELVCSRIREMEMSQLHLQGWGSGSGVGGGWIMSQVGLQQGSGNGYESRGGLQHGLGTVIEPA